ncbi:MAG: hypothetical protein JNJ48_06885 [Phycisphaerae bacterium]|nr:hypothetical protein [Phycisphaerae bacterium]
MKRAWNFAAVGAMAACLAAAGRQPAGSPVSPAPVGQPGVAAIPVPRLSERLARLSPDDPTAYFLLGEEVASESVDRSSRDLARTLLVLAMHLDRAAGGTGNLTPSVCLALASLTPREGERRWLVAVARASERRAGERAGRTRPPGLAPVSELVAFDLATAFGLIRAGEGRRAEQLLAKPAVAELLSAYENVLDDEGIVGGAQRLRRWAEQWQSCPECRNRRIVTRGEGGKARLCPTCGGSPGPKLSEAELLVQLRMESALLRGIHRLWSAQYLADGGEPLRDPDAADLPATYGVDTTRTVWREGQWRQP